MRDDLFELTPEQRREARAAWGRVSLRQRRAADVLAKQGRPVPDPEVSDAARRAGEYVLQKNWTNRLPRTFLPAVGVVAVAVGVARWTGPGGSGAAWLFGPVVTAVGAVGVLFGLLHWDMRRSARRLVAANPARPTASRQG